MLQQALKTIVCSGTFPFTLWNYCLRLNIFWLSYTLKPLQIFIAITSFFPLPKASGSTANKLLQYVETTAVVQDLAKRRMR